MPTLQQIEQFKQKARSAGFSEIQIANEIARKTQEDAKQTISNPNPTNKGTLLQNMTGGKGMTGFVNNVGKFIAPATQNIMRDVVASKVVGSKEYKQANESVRAAQKQAQDLIKKANQTKDKDLKKKYLDLARQLNNQATQNLDTDNLFSEDVNKDVLSRGLASGTELASLTVPISAKGTTAVQRTLSMAKQGAVLSGARTATSLDEMTPEERLIATGKSALIGGTLAGGIQGAGEVVRKVKGAGKILETEGGKLRQGVRQIKQPASVYGAKKEQAINETLNELKISGTPDQQYALLEPKMNELETKIQEVIKANPDISIKLGDIKTSFISNLKSALRSKDLTATQAKSEIEGYLKDLIKASGGKGKFTSISLDRIRELKKLVNEDFGPVHAAMEKGTALTPRQKVIAAAWDSLDQAVKDASPEMKKLLLQESHLYQAAPSLSSARFNPPTLRAAGTSVPAIITQGGLDVAGKAVTGVGKVLSKLPVLPKTGVAGMGTRLIPAVANGLSQPSMSEQTQEENYAPENNGGEDYSSGDFQHENIIASSQHPIFGNISKQELLTEAFKSGLNGKQLDEIEALYDRFDPTSTGNKKMSSGQQNLMAEYDSGLEMMNGLAELVESNSSAFVPVVSKARSINPLDTEVLDAQAQIKLIAQIVGRALEGGVLRKEDIPKYEAILPKVGDTKEVARRKINNVINSLKIKKRVLESIAGNTTQTGVDNTTINYANE